MMKLSLVIYSLILLATAGYCITQDVREFATVAENALDAVVEDARFAVTHMTTAHQQLVDDPGTEYKPLQFKIKVNAMEVRHVIKQLRDLLEAHQLNSEKFMTKETINTAAFQSNINDHLHAVNMMVDEKIRAFKKEIQTISVNSKSTLKSLDDEVQKAGQERTNKVVMIEKSIAEDEEAVKIHNVQIEKLKQDILKIEEVGNHWVNLHYNEKGLLASLQRALWHFWSFLCNLLSRYISWFSCPQTYDEIVEENRKLLAVWEKHTKKKGELEAQIKEGKLLLKKLKTNQPDLSTAETGLKAIISFLDQLNIVLGDVNNVISEMKLWLEKFSKPSDASKKLSNNDSFNKGVIHFSSQWKIIGSFAGKHSEALEKVTKKLQIIYRAEASEIESSKKLTDEKKRDEL